MNNRFLTLLFFLVCFISMDAMEIVSQEDELVRSFKEKEKALKKMVQFNQWIPGPFSRSYRIPSSEWFDSDDLLITPLRFLQFIHNERYYEWAEYSCFTMDELNAQYAGSFATNLILRETCKNVRVNGYSALGVAILRGAGTSLFPQQFALQRQRKIIQKLLKIGFEPTPADQELAYLELYARTPEITKRNLLLFAGMMKNPESNLAMLPMELLLKIIPNDQEPLIPRRLCKDCRKIRKIS